MIRVIVHLKDGKTITFYTERLDDSLITCLRNPSTRQKITDESNLPAVIRASNRQRGDTSVDSLWISPENVSVVTTTFLPDVPIGDRPRNDPISFRILWSHTPKDENSQYDLGVRLGDDCPICTAIHDEAERFAREQGW